jgi:2-polyprenyl-3-methyl-5-hydroxy-6-metoxy-1,4-benzoquinol methylase
MSYSAAGYLEQRPERETEPSRIRPFGDLLGDVAGKRVLEYGCGGGELAVRLARSGARVSTFDISYSSVEKARRLAESNGVRIEAVEAAAERLPYADETFEVVVGRSVLHLLDVERAPDELRRILRPGGKAVFSEPLRQLDLGAWRKGFERVGKRELGLAGRLPFLRPYARQALVWMVR